MIDIKQQSGEETHHRNVLFDKLIWTIEEVCQFTTYKRGTIYNLVSEGSIPYRKCGRKLFFVPSEILYWIKGERK
ncbi:MAG: helix-turn-helix domain-containing protein [Pseudobdellovibrionaceae bacterium]|nr:MAG: helix-turn-helix domain-containing protein [Pseudobdellovibrionaceae bacterium]